MGSKGYMPNNFDKNLYLDGATGYFGNGGGGGGGHNATYYTASSILSQ